MCSDDHALLNGSGVINPLEEPKLRYQRNSSKKDGLPRNESIVVSMTGNGYKTLPAVARSIDKLYTVRAELAHFDQLYQNLNPSFSKRLPVELPLMQRLASFQATD
jgi:hypothetical protein